MENKIVLRDYQEKAVNDVFDYIINKGGNPCVIASTGAGKTIIIAEIIRRGLSWWPNSRILVLTHQKELIEQDYNKLKLLAPNVDMGIYSASLKQKDASHSVTFASIQSISKNTEARFNVVIVDECHLINNDEQGNYRSYLGMLNCKVIGLTATPYRLGQGQLVGEGTIFNGYIETIGILELQARGYLSRLSSKTTKTILDVRDIAKVAGEYKQKELDQKVNTYENNEAIAKELAWYIREGYVKHLLVFCTSVEHAYAMKAAMNNEGINTVCVEGQMSKETREENIRQFTEGKAECITNVNILSTGFDYPAIDGIALLRPTLSTGLYVQQVGRGLRVAPNKDKCLLLDFADNVKRHGPIAYLSSIPTKDSKGNGKGVPPMKTCPECLEILPSSARICITCGHEFPQHPKEFRLFLGDVNGDEKEGHFIDGWNWLVKTSKKGFKMWQVTYNTQLLSKDTVKSIVKEYLVFDSKASSYAIRKTIERMMYLSEVTNINHTKYQRRDGSYDFEAWGNDIGLDGTLPVALITQRDGEYTRIVSTISEMAWREAIIAEGKENKLREKTFRRIDN